MPITRASIIGGPAKVVFSGGTFFSKGDISLVTDTQTIDVESAVHGKIDERAVNINTEVSFEPVGEWENLAVLWPYQTPTTLTGKSIFTASDVPLVITGVDGAIYTLAAAAVSRMPDIHIGADKSAIGPVTFAAVRPNADVSWATGAAPLAITSGAYSDATFGQAAIAIGPSTAAWGAVAGFTALETAAGWDIVFETGIGDVSTDAGGVCDKKLTRVGVMAKCVPVGPTAAQILAAAKLTGLARGYSMNAQNAGVDLVITGTGLTVTVKAAGLKTSGYKFGSTILRNGEIGFVGTIGFAIGVPAALVVLA